MKITVLSGSPKGDLSITLQYVKLIQKKTPQHTFKVHHVSQNIQRIERDRQVFLSIIDDILTSDGILWSFPVYVFLIPSQYKHFIELIWEKGAQSAFKDKYAASISTSIHFYDHAAHDYISAICDDLDMRFMGSFSADMDDIFIEQMRARLLTFARGFFEAIENSLPSAKSHPALIHSKFNYRPRKTKEKIDTYGKKVILVTDTENDQSNLAKMAQKFKDSLRQDIEVFNLHHINMSDGCLGCLQCAFDNICIYRDKDEFIDFFNKLRNADITIHAGTIKDRFLSARTKTFWDRSFFNGHIPAQAGKQIGFIISGPLAQIPNLRQVLEAMAELQRANLVGIVTDECENSSHLDLLLHNLANKCVQLSVQNYIRPQTFLGVGGHKLLRDFIWARGRFPFIADYKYYRKHGMFDFPQKDKRNLKRSNQMLDLIKTPEMKETVRKMMKSEIVKPYQKAMEIA